MNAAVLLIILLLSHPAGAHGDADWIRRDPVTGWCCGTHDCRRLTAGELSRGPGGAWLVNGMAVAATAVYPTKPEGGGAFWACFYPPDYRRVRCLFVPAMF